MKVGSSYDTADNNKIESVKVIYTLANLKEKFSFCYLRFKDVSVFFLITL